MKTLINKANPQIRITAPEITRTEVDGVKIYWIPGVHEINGSLLLLDDWTLVDEPKFKIGDKINLIGRENTEYNILTITSIRNEEQCYICHQGSVIGFKEQDQWALVEEEETRKESLQVEPEFEHRRKDTIYFLETAKTHYADTSELEKCIEWLKGLQPTEGIKGNLEEL